MNETQRFRELVKRLGWDAVIPLLIGLMCEEVVGACREFDAGKAGMWQQAYDRMKDVSAALGQGQH